jgi:hypothetical protein
MTLLQRAALAYARSGLFVHPLRGKIPLVDNWPRIATNDVAQVTAWWRRRPNANVGCVSGKSGLLVVDVDNEAAEDEARALGLLNVHTLRVITARGYHLHFRRGGAERLAPMRVRHGRRVTSAEAALELKCDGASVVLPPSVHPSGHEYRFADKRAPIAPCPPDVWRLLVSLQHVAPPARRPLLRGKAGGSDGHESVIAAFNRAHDICELLESLGYRRDPRGRRATRLIAPSSTTGTAGVVILNGRAYSHHASDPLGDGHAHSAFDVFCRFEHGGDVRRAVKAAAAALGMASFDRRSRSTGLRINATEAGNAARTPDMPLLLRRALEPPQ